MNTEVVESMHNLSQVLMETRLKELPKDLLKPLVVKDTSEINMAIERIRKQLPEIKRMNEEFRDKSFEKLMREARKTTFVQNGYFWRVIEVLYMFIPVTIVGVVLIASGHWPLVILHSISVQFQAVESGVVGDFTAKVGDFVMHKILEMAWRITCFAASILLAAAVIAGLTFIIYSTIYRKMCVHHVNGMIRTVDSGMPAAWYLVLAIAFDENCITHTNRYLMTIRKELVYDHRLTLHTPDKWVTLVEYGGQITLSSPVNVHFQTSVPRIDSEQVEINEENIEFGLIKGPNLKSLNGQLATVSLQKLNRNRPRDI